ncbi:hypothetical protein BX666DRAFT_1936511 [Dichotomocladium elegans]|nr:hypothetical protein BX666DRAFT_1936511 [Dichotomocladium elegans]
MASESSHSSLLSSKRRHSTLEEQKHKHSSIASAIRITPGSTFDDSSLPPTPYPFMDLATFLWQSPFLFRYSLNEVAKRSLLQKCYSMLWKNQDDVMEQHFFADKVAFSEAIDRLMLHRHRRAHNQQNAMATDTDVDMGQTDSSPVLQRCGRVFRKGEPIYRCRDCGLDETCVLCSKCFHSSDHENHNVTVSISSGSAGCCDCGDSEAWRRTLECSIHGTTPLWVKPSPQKPSIPRPVLKHVRQTIVTILDFVLVTFALASEEVSIPSSNAEIVHANQSECAAFRRIGVPARRPLKFKRKLEDDVDMDKENHAINDDQLYALIAWNDETHSFKDVCESIIRATACNYDQARRIVETIHIQGREIISISTNLDELRSMATPLTAIGFGVTIRPARDVFREQVAAVLIDWLQDLAHDQQMPIGPHIRTILCEELCANWKLPKQIAILTGGTPSFRRMSGEEEVEEDYEDEFAEDDETMQSGFEEEDIDMADPEEPPSDIVVPMVEQLMETDQASKIIYQTEKDIASIDWNPAWLVKDHRQYRAEEQKFEAALRLPLQELKDMTETRWLAFAVQQEFEEKQRLDYFLLYDQRVWKELRLSLRGLYVITLGSHPVYKKRLGKRFVRNYARLLDAFLFRDREPENAISIFSVQLLTVPSVATLLVNEYYFFDLICNILPVFFLTEEICYMPSNKRQNLTNQLSCESRAFRSRRYFNAFSDLRYILEVGLLKPVIAQDPVYLREFLELISLFQAMNPQVCQKDTHVEYESEIWVNAFNVTLQIAKCSRAFAECYSAIKDDKDRIRTSQILVRAIARILKALDEWGPHQQQQELSGADTTEKPPIQVPATANCKYHTVNLPYLGDISVVNYDISVEPVSFHHPLHWLLACVLETVTWLDNDLVAQAGWEEGFVHAIQMFSPQAQTLLQRVLDYPIRTLAFSSQIRAGVWVRNGYNIRNQVHHYRDISLRETTYDSDIFLLQFAFVSIDPNLVLVTLMDRFDLIDWFKGETQHKQYDSTQATFMVEEMLYLLIVCASERSNATHASITEKIRREIIHHLCLGPSVYSELTKRIPERFAEKLEFDQILNEVALYRPPTSLMDSGRYELRDEYYDCIDPYFWHYSRNNRGEAETALRERWKKANPGKDESTFFVQPKPLLAIDGIFSNLYRFLQSPVLLQMLVYTFMNVMEMGEAHKSDTIVDQALYLTLLAVSSQDANECCEYYIERTYTKNERTATLFEIMIQYRRDDKFKETHARIDRIFEQMMLHGSENVKHKLQATLRETLQQQQQQDLQTLSIEEQKQLSEQELKKKAAQERQKRIMEMFAQAQNAFMEQNEDLLEDDDEGDLREDGTEATAQTAANPSALRQQMYDYPTGTCIVCQEDVNERSLPYGMLGLVQISNILRETDMENKDMLEQMLMMGPNLNKEWPNREISDRSICGSFPADHQKSGLCATTCSHLMHIQCFDTYYASIDARHAAQLTRNHPENRQRKEFTCPLCKSLGNILLPVIWRGKMETYPSVLVNADEESYNRFLQNGIHMTAEKLQTAVDPYRPMGFGLWSAGGDSLFAPRLPSLKGVQGEDTRDKIPGLSTLLGVEHRGGSNQLGPPDMLFRGAIGVAQAIEAAYIRLQEVFAVILDICGADASRSLSSSVKNVDTLWGMLGFTISALEIASRGTSPTYSGANVFSQLPAQSQTLLRILCDTILSYTNLMCQTDMLSSSRLFNNPARESRAMVQVHMLAMQRMLQIFATDTVTTSRQAAEVPPDTRLFDNPPLLSDDPFMILSELSAHLVQVTKADIYPFIRILLLAEITKATVGFLQNPPPTATAGEAEAMNIDRDTKAAHDFALFVADTLNMTVDVDDERFGDGFCRLLKLFALPYLRRTVILLVARFGVLFDERAVCDDVAMGGDSEKAHVETEFDELLEMLRLPGLSVLLGHPDTEQMVKGWCSQLLKESERRGIEQMTLALDLPCPFFLIKLPSRLDALMDESMARICPRCETVPTDPAVCLLCGTFVCSQSFCCAEGEEGECNLHMLECGGEIGIYLLIKKCSLLVLHDENGWFMQAPYLDSHGEADHGLR